MTSVLSACGIATVLPWGKSVECFLAYVTWQVMLLCTTQWAHPYRKYFTVHDWPPFPLWLYCHSVVIHLVSVLTYTLVLLRQLPPISLCKRVSISRVAIVKGLGPCVKYKGHPLQKVIFFVALASGRKLNLRIITVIQLQWPTWKLSCTNNICCTVWANRADAPTVLHRDFARMLYICARSGRWQQVHILVITEVTLVNLQCACAARVTVVCHSVILSSTTVPAP